MRRSGASPAPEHDVIIVGGGPAGSAAAIVLARAGHRVLVVEARPMPRPKTCAGAISPPALALLEHLGFASFADHPRVDRIRIVADRRTIERPWPAAAHGIVVRRERFDQQLLDHARACGAAVLEGHEARSPIIERGLVHGVQVAVAGGELQSIHARYVIVADGANSRFGRTLGTWRDRRRPYATAIHATWPSELHLSDAIEIVPALTHPDGHRLSGYGWVFPAGDGSVDIGVGVLSTTEGFRSINTSHLLEAFLGSVATRWRLSSLEALSPALSGRIPLGGSVGPIASPTTLVVGDAAGVANAISGSGIDTALATGAIAASVVAAALAHDDPTVLQEYPRRVARAFARSSRRGRYVERAVRSRRLFALGVEAMSRWPWFADRVIEFGVDTVDTGEIETGSVDTGADLPGRFSSRPA